MARAPDRRSGARWRWVSALQSQGELDLARGVDGGVEDLVVEQLGRRLVEVDGGAGLLHDLVAGLGLLGGRDREGRVGRVLAGDAEPSGLGESRLGGDLVD